MTVGTYMYQHFQTSVWGRFLFLSFLQRTMKGHGDIKLYVSAENSHLLQIKDTLKAKNINYSDEMCKILLHHYSSNNSIPPPPPPSPQPHDKKEEDDFISLFIKSYQQLEQKHLVNISNHIERKIYKNEITYQGLADFMTFLILAFNQMFSNDFLFNFFKETPEFLLIAKRDMLHPLVIRNLKHTLIEQIRNHFNKIQQNERLNEAAQKADLEKQRDEERLKEYKIRQQEVKKWLKDNPDKAPWMYGLTDSEIKTEESIMKAIKEGTLITNKRDPDETESELNRDTYM